MKPRPIFKRLGKIQEGDSVICIRDYFDEYGIFECGEIYKSINNDEDSICIRMGIKNIPFWFPIKIFKKYEGS